MEDGSIGEIRLLNTQKSYKLGRRGENYKSREVYGGTIPGWKSWGGLDKMV